MAKRKVVDKLVTQHVRQNPILFEPVVKEYSKMKVQTTEPIPTIKSDKSNPIAQQIKGAIEGITVQQSGKVLRVGNQEKLLSNTSARILYYLVQHCISEDSNKNLMHTLLFQAYVVYVFTGRNEMEAALTPDVLPDEYIRYGKILIGVITSLDKNDYSLTAGPTIMGG